MKRILITMVAVFMAMSPLAAQKGFQSDSVFTLKTKSQVVESVVKGRQLDAYNLDYFRSVRFKANGAEVEKIMTWFDRDAKASMAEKRVTSQGRVVYILLRFPGSGPEKWQYLGFQQKPVEGADYAYVTVVYLRGKATPEELAKIFKHRTI